MPNLATLVSAAAGAGRFVPDKPELNHHTTSGQFIITNYDSRLTYVISSGTRSNDIITLGTSGTVSCDVLAYSPKGVVGSSTANCERRSYTYYTYQCGTTPGNCSYLPNCADCGGCAGCTNCANPSGGLCIFCTGGDPIYCTAKNATPAGFTDSYNEWWKVS